MKFILKMMFFNKKTKREKFFFFERNDDDDDDDDPPQKIIKFNYKNASRRRSANLSDYVSSHSDVSVHFFDDDDPRL